LIKGRPRILIKDGKIIWDVLEENQISKEDLLEIIRDKLKTDDLDQIKEAYLERTGKISFIIKNKKI
ncbi:TPA: YetF domain-containing protein, partial [Legionella anisa]